MIVGSDNGVFSEFAKAVPAATGRRIYYDTRDVWPPSWPESGVGPASDLVSIRPDPARLLAGELDISVLSFISTAPPGSALSAWHEAGNLPEYRAMPDINPANMTAVHRYMAGLCAGSNVAYGPVLCMPPQHMAPWMPPGMDWYGLDIYDTAQFQLRKNSALPVSLVALYERLGYWADTVRAISGQDAPALVIAETNSNVQARRPQWFASVGDWLLENGGTRMLTFWNPNGPLSGPWVPGDTATVAVLQALATASG